MIVEISVVGHLWKLKWLVTVEPQAIDRSGNPCWLAAVVEIEVAGHCGDLSGWSLWILKWLIVVETRVAGHCGYLSGWPLWKLTRHAIVETIVVGNCAHFRGWSHWKFKHLSGRP